MAGGSRKSPRSRYRYQNHRSNRQLRSAVTVVEQRQPTFDDPPCKIHNRLNPCSKCLLEQREEEEEELPPPADIFQSSDVQRLLFGKRVVFLGDSNIRALYKDMLFLSQHNRLIGLKSLKTVVHESFGGDRLVYANRTKGRSFREERQYLAPKFELYYAFLTRIYSDYVLEWVEKFSRCAPDIVVVNSCLWDIARWGPNGVEEYKRNLVRFFDELKRVLPSKTLVIWMTVPPLSQKMHKGFMIPQLNFLELSLRFHVMEGNTYAAEVASKHGFDVLDVHYFLRTEVSQREKDGIHWSPSGVRFINCLLLTHIAKSFGFPLPDNFRPTSTRIFNNTK